MVGVQGLRPKGYDINFLFAVSLGRREIMNFKGLTTRYGLFLANFFNYQQF